MPAECLPGAEHCCRCRPRGSQHGQEAASTGCAQPPGQQRRLGGGHLAAAPASQARQAGLAGCAQQHQQPCQHGVARGAAGSGHSSHAPPKAGLACRLCQACRHMRGGPGEAASGAICIPVQPVAWHHALLWVPGLTVRQCVQALTCLPATPSARAAPAWQSPAQRPTRLQCTPGMQR